MKLLSVIAAGLMAVTGLAAAAPAAAQDRVVVRERVVTPRATERRVIVRERTTVRRSNRDGYRRNWRGNWRRNQWRRGHAYAYGHGRQRVCTVRYRRDARIRTCRIRRF